MTLCFPIGSERKLLKWLQENIEKLMMLNKRRRWFHAWNSLWLPSQQVGFWCQHILFGPLVPSWFCRTTNQAQLCGFWHVSHCWTSSFDNHLDDSFVVFKIVQLRIALRRMCVGGYIIHVWQLLNLSLSLFRLCFGLVFFLMEGSPVPHKSPWASLPCLAVLFAVLFVERNTSITTSQGSKAGTPFIRSPASKEMISDSVELWDTDICFLHIQLTGTNVRLPKIHKTPPVDFESSRSPPKSESSDNAEPCYPHDNIVGIHLCDECMKSILQIVCRMPESILWLLLQVWRQTTECLVSQLVPGTNM